MVFSSIPAYLDPPNWNQQQAQHPGSGGGGGDLHDLPPQQSDQDGMGAPPRPALMADRARLAKASQPEQALNCPRCDSTNTKFCYFNNYSLSQPRHFCKTCGRYWTRGGALRNVPVGGGCRRNKRSKASGISSSKSQTTGDRQSGTSLSSSTLTTTMPSGGSLLPQLPFMASLHPLPDYNTTNKGLNLSGMHPIQATDYQVGGSSSIGLEQWRFQQTQHFPFMGGLEVPSAAPPVLQGLYPNFDNNQGRGVDGAGRQFTWQAASSSGLITQPASVKMEERSRGFNMSRQHLGFPRNDQYPSGGNNGGGGGGGWMMDLTGINSTSSGNLL